MNRKIGIVLGTLAILFYFFALYGQEKPNAETSVSSYGDTATATSRVVKALKKSNPEAVTILGEAILSADQLAQTSLLIMTSLVRAVSDHEAKQIGAYVEDGGTLLLSFHDRRAMAQISALMDALAYRQTVVDSKTFRNYETETVRFGSDNWFFRADETYSVYSPLIFGNQACQDAAGSQIAADCFFEVRSVGLGKVITVLGIPFFANGLVGHEDNARVTARIFSSQSQTTFDEFHHYFSDKTLLDLLSLPAFFLPLAGLVICLLLFFILGPSYQIEPVAIAPLAPLRGFHEVNVALLQSELRNASGEAVTLQARFLERHYPHQASEVETVVQRARNERTDARSVFWQLCEMHQKLLLDRGRRRKA